MCNKCPDGVVRKPVVFYKTNKKPTIIIGERVLLVPINHTSNLVTNNRVANTSKVLTALPNGVFETLNTIYKPEEMQ